MQRVVVLAFVCSLALFALAKDVPVTVTYTFSQNYGTDTVVAVTSKQTTMPSDLPTPIFWFDCSQRDGWEFAKENGTNFVTKIPSLVGDRFLTTNLTLAGTSWTGWGNGHVPKPPMLLEFDDLPGGPALDFGPDHSDRGLIFSPKDGASDLTGIGSIVAIWGSANGGGYILGGGDNGGFFWARGFENVLKGPDSVDLGWWCTVLNWNDYSGDFRSGVFMSDAFLSPIENVGLCGTWEVAALQGSTTLRSALGVGLGDTRQSYVRNGGCQFGEMLIFGEQLTEDQLRRVSVYLKEKWLSRGTKGWNGDANLGKYTMIPNETSWSQSVYADAGETLTIQKAVGGHNGGPGSTFPTAITKVGEGTLVVQDASAFAAPIKVRAGDIVMAPRRDVTGTAEDIPFGVFARFDASETSSLVLSNDTTTGRRYIERMENLGFGKYQGQPIALIPPACQYRDLRPWLIEPRYGAKLPLVYGSHRTADGRYFNIYYKKSDGTYARTYITGVATVLAVVSAQNGGGHLGDNALQRVYRWVGDGSYATTILNITVDSSTGPEKLIGEAKIPMRGSVLWLDGIVANSTSGYPDFGTHVVAAQIPATYLNTIGAENYYCGTGATDSGAHGGLIFGEILIYTRYLTEEEIVRAQAYLMKKWFGTNAPQYANVESDAIAQIQEVRTEMPTALTVPDGMTAMVTRVMTDAPLYKKGGGVLNIGPGSETPLLQIMEGAVKVVRPTPETAADCTVAKGASMHLDASDTNTIETVVVDGVKRVTAWYSKSGQNFAKPSAEANRPFLNETDKLNGMPTVDFGNGTDNQYWLGFVNTLCSVRSVFMVCGTQEGGSQILGEWYNGTVRNAVDYWRAAYSLDSPIAIAGARSVAYCTEFWHDGVKTNASKAYYTGGWDQLDMHTSIGMQAGALATSRGNTDSYDTIRRGRMRIAEVIIYEHELSDRERVATRNYLTKKWFPSRKLETLPSESAVDTTLQLAVVDATEDETVDMNDPVEAHRVIGSGTLTKNGSGSLDVDDLNGFDGTLDVRAGSLHVGPVVGSEPKLKETGRVLHFDANYGVETVTNEDYTVSVSSWRDRMGNRTAVPRYYASTTSRATLLPWGLHGNPVVDLPANVSMWWQKDGEYASITNIGTVLWVFGSQNGGGFLLGGGAQGSKDGQYDCYAWHRGWDPVQTQSVGLGPQYYQDSVWCGSGYGPIGSGTWRVNGEQIVATARGTLSGGWDVISWQAKLQDGVPLRAPAAGFAFDGRAYRYGCQRLAEVIIYDHRLTDDEVAEATAYLEAKWGFRQASATQDAAIVLAAGTTLETDGAQVFRSISGSGTVKNDVTVNNFTAAYGQTGITVAGTMTIGASPAITLANLPADPGAYPVTIPVATAQAYEGEENLLDATFVGASDSWRVRVEIKNGTIYVTVAKIGSLIIVW